MSETGKATLVGRAYAVGEEADLYELCRCSRHDQYHFRFAAGDKVYMTRGGRSYGSVGGYDGGPWYAREDTGTRVVIVAVKAV